MVFYERASGSRMHAAYFRRRRRAPGSAAEADRRHRGVLRSVPEGLSTTSKTLLTGNRIFKQRNVDIGVVKLDGRLGLGLLRRDGARLGRGLGSAQGAALRMLCRAGFRHSDRQERRLLRPLLHPHGRDAPVDPHHEAVPAKSCARRKGRGRSSVDDNKIVPPKRGEMKRSMEALIHHFKLYTEGFHVPAGEVYAAVEAPKGEFGVYLVADGTNKPYKCKIRAPGFAHLQAMDFLCKRPHAGRRLGHPRLARHRVRGGRPLMSRPPPRPARTAAEGLRLHGGEPRLGEEADRQISGGPPGSRRSFRCCGARRSRPAAGCRKRRSSTSPIFSAWRTSACSRSRPSTPCSIWRRSANSTCSSAARRRAGCAARTSSIKVCQQAASASSATSPRTASSPGSRSSASAPASTRRWCRSTTTTTRT